MTIKEARIKSGLTQKEAADKLKVPVRTLQNWEEGKRRPTKYLEEFVTNVLLTRY